MNISGTQSSIKSSVNPSFKQNDVVRSLKKQIEKLKKQLNELNADEQMDPKLKLEKKKDLEQQILELNKQIAAIENAQKQIDKTREQLLNKNEKTDSKQKVPQNSDKKNYDTFSESFTKNITKLNNAMSLSSVVDGVKNDLKSKADILETEIKLDGGRGASIKSKTDELVEIKAKANGLDVDLTKRIADINKKENKFTVKTEKEEEKEDRIKEDNEEEINSN